jgi:uncharacterized protein (DUF2147 family)
MKYRGSRLGLFAITAFAVLGAAPAFSAVDGMWLHSDGTIVRISNCGGAMCGVIAGVRPGPQQSTDGSAAHTGGHVRPAVGTQVLISMHPDGPGKWSGQLFNPDDGKIYAGHLIELAPDQVRIEGCWLAICGGENLTRVKATASTR